MSALYPSPPGYPVSYQWDLLLAGPCRRMSAGSWLTWALIAAQLEIWPTFFRWTGHRCCFSCRFCLWLDSGPFYGLSFGSAFTDANVSGRVPVFFWDPDASQYSQPQNWLLSQLKKEDLDIYIYMIYIWYKSRDWPSTREVIEVITWNAQVTCRWISMATAAKNCWWPNGVSKNWGAKGGCCSVANVAIGLEHIN